MKKTFLSLLASSLCFAGIAPVFAGTTPISPGNCILYNNFGSGAPDGGLFDNMSRTKVFITLEGQKFILGELNAKSLPVLNPLAQGNPAIKDFVFLLTGDKGKVNFNSPEIDKSQANLVGRLTGLGLDLGDGRPARQLVAALTLLIPFGNEATPSETIGVAAVDGTKFYQAITAFNSLVNELVNTANGTGPEAAKAQATLNALLKDETFNSISSTLRALREQLKDKESKEETR
ncbi:hypothetical protein [Pseudanabaena yagii]|uniref:Uncharacterized protein n=1 Tax=Pseudanabaena yagii GIHE-NHR1 TaxID=2722753 RepID=A0ABX1LNU5_9CYAN|nr:hypothetical protein [Pseudanabaena yagii]NMF57797.1 hypothetical protein [Pseudanabaena yagii GIHE-NHR1]